VETFVSGEDEADRASAAFERPAVSSGSTESAWRASQGSHNVDEGAHERLCGALASLNDLSKDLNKVFPHIADRSDPSLADARAIVAALHHVAAAPPSSRLALKNPAWVNELLEIETAVVQGRRLSEVSADVATQFRDEAWTVDTAPLVAILRKDGRSPLRRLTKRYRRAQAELRALCRSRPPNAVEDQICLLEKLHDAQATRRAFLEQGAFLSAVLGPIWNEFLTNWDEAKALVAWTRVALTLIGRERIVEMAARSEDLSAISKFANWLETLLQRTDANFSELVGDKRTGDLLADIAGHNTVPISSLCQGVRTAVADYDQEE
jgi:hypothetical protein